jgi:hypothetical protein
MADDYKLVNANRFKKAIDDVREKGELYKANVHPYSTDEYKDMRTYLSSDGKSGYAIKPDGELVSVHSGVKGRGDNIVRDAVKRGATKLDAYDIKGKLPDLYGKHGFKETGRFPFDPQYAEDLEILKKERPDFVTMEKEGQTAKQLEARRKAVADKLYKMKQYSNLTPEFEKELDAKHDLIKKKIGERAAAERAESMRIKGTTEQVDPGKMVGEGTREKIDTKMRGKGYTDKIDTSPQKTMDITDEWAKRRGLVPPSESIAKKRALAKAAKMGGKRVLSALPLVGGLAAAMATGDASAAVPVLGDADPLGPQAGSLEAAVQDPSLSREQRMKALQELMKRNKGE